MSNQTMAQVEPLIKYLAQEYPESPDYTTSACWADDLKSEDVMFNEDQVRAATTWHYCLL